MDLYTDWFWFPLDNETCVIVARRSEHAPASMPGTRLYIGRHATVVKEGGELDEVLTDTRAWLVDSDAYWESTDDRAEAFTVIASAIGKLFTVWAARCFNENELAKDVSESN